MYIDFIVLKPICFISDVIFLNDLKETERDKGKERGGGETKTLIKSRHLHEFHDFQTSQLTSKDV